MGSVACQRTVLLGALSCQVERVQRPIYRFECSRAMLRRRLSTPTYEYNATLVRDDTRVFWLREPA